MIDIRKDYLALNRTVLYSIAAEFFIQLISTTLLHILPLYMHSNGYSDADIAGYISFRFLGLLIITVPLGFYIKGRRLKGFLIATGIMVPLAMIASVEAVSEHIGWLLIAGQSVHGVFYAFTSTVMLPFIVRNEKAGSYIEAIALHFVVWSLGSLISGWMVGFLNILSPRVFSIKNILLLISVTGFANLYYLSKIKEEHVPKEKSRFAALHKDFDWKVIGYALVPAILIAIGAGLAIPYLGLFFANVHDMTTSTFALIMSFASVLVVMATLYIPTLKRRMGFRSAITKIQFLGIMALVVLASTEYFNMYQFAVIVAVAAYFFRNPLMNMVGPLTSELSMNFVGEKNQDIMSALMSAISSGGYFVSAIIFKSLRQINTSYAVIFYITAGLYMAAVFFYYHMAGRYLKSNTTA